MRESKIERHFCQQVSLHGGVTRKPRWYGAPDRIAIWPRATQLGFEPHIHFVELKAPTGRAKGHQLREHKRLRALGCKVFMLYSKPQVDHYIAVLRHQ